MESSLHVLSLPSLSLDLFMAVSMSFPGKTRACVTTFEDEATLTAPSPTRMDALRRARSAKKFRSAGSSVSLGSVKTAAGPSYERTPSSFCASTDETTNTGK